MNKIKEPVKTIFIKLIFIFLIFQCQILLSQNSSPPNFIERNAPVTDAPEFIGLGPVAYDNGDSDPNTDCGNEMSEWVQADDFELAKNQTIAGAEIDWFDLNYGNEWDGEIKWYIFAEISGSPGEIIDQGTGIERMTTLISNAHGWDWWTTAFEFDHPVNLLGGKRYFFGLHWAGDDDYFRDEVYWAYSDMQIYKFSQESYRGDFINWTIAGSEDRPFKLFLAKETTIVPTLSEWSLILIGLVMAILGIVTLKQRNNQEIIGRTFRSKPLE